KDTSGKIKTQEKSPVSRKGGPGAENQKINPAETPPLFVLPPPWTGVRPDAEKPSRLSYPGPVCPADRESVYWLTVLEIPPVGEKGTNQVQVAFRSRIKLFYRPVTLDDKGARKAIAQLRWQAQGNHIILSNPTAYYVSAVAVTATHAGKKTTIPADMLAPHGSLDLTLPSGVVADGLTVEAINDYGSSVTEPVNRL
ncbi:molecular chaperone, partial [Citrobacter freundii]|uniref:fimbrial biogenesis chaperone n=1 Tax=Citrobacter freundii TaxID=546 RepID=UPI00186B87AC